MSLAVIILGHVVFHIRYTARQGVDPSKVKETLRDIFEEGSKSNLVLLFSLRHDFPTEWNAFDKSEKNAPFTATIRKNYFPYFTQGKQITIVGYHIYDGEDVTRHEEIDKERWNEATTALNDKEKQSFNVTIARGDPGPTQVMKPGAQVFLIIRYSLS